MILPIILGVVGVVVAAFIILVAMKRPDFRIERSATIAATPQAVFEQVNDFRKWRAWSPWEKRDPLLRRTYEGAPAGRGAVYSWIGNKQVGEGRMTITESRPGELVRIRLEFIKPFAATNTAEFTFQPQGDQTRVTWSMSGTHTFVMRAFCMFMNMDKLVGGDFEKGLAAMKLVAERPTTEPALA